MVTSRLRTGFTPISERELRYFGNETIRIVFPRTNEKGEKIGMIDIILDPSDLEYMIEYMKINKLPFTIQEFKKVQDVYIESKADLNNPKVNNYFTKCLRRV